LSFTSQKGYPTVIDAAQSPVAVELHFVQPPVALGNGIHESGELGLQERGQFRLLCTRAIAEVLWKLRSVSPAIPVRLCLASRA
jgi:hypothetical protein